MIAFAYQPITENYFKQPQNKGQTFFVTLSMNNPKKNKKKNETNLTLYSKSIHFHGQIFFIMNKRKKFKQKTITNQKNPKS